MKWKVRYDLPNGETRETEWYDSLSEACSHRDDIQGYEGITNVDLVSEE